MKQKEELLAVTIDQNMVLAFELKEKNLEIEVLTKRVKELELKLYN